MLASEQARHSGRNLRSDGCKVASPHLETAFDDIRLLIGPWWRIEGCSLCEMKDSYQSARPNDVNVKRHKPWKGK